MKKYINTSNYYLSTTTSKIENTGTSGTFDVSDVTVDWVTLPLTGYYWVDVDFGDSSKREIFRIVSRSWYTLTYDDRISPYGMKTHQSWASVGLRDFSQLLNSLSTNTDNFWEVEQTGDLSILVRGGNVFLSGSAKADTWVKEISSSQFDLQANTVTYIVVDIDEILYSFAAITNTDYLLDEWQYPIAKITTWANAINEIKDLRSTMIGGWDMRSAVYDPEWKRRELYLMDNMEQSVDWQHLFVNQAQVDLWNSYQTTKQDLLISWTNIKTINNTSVLWSWNIDTNQVSNDTYSDSWDWVDNIAPSKNAVYDKIKTIDIDVSWKQDTLIPGNNIQIAADWKTISATDTTYVAWDFDIKDLADSTSLRNKWDNKQNALVAWPNITIDWNTISAINTLYFAWAWLTLNGTTFNNTWVLSVNWNNWAVTVDEFKPSNTGNVWQVLKKTSNGYEWSAETDAVTSVNWQTWAVVVNEFSPLNVWETWQVLKKTSTWYSWWNESWGGGWDYTAWEGINISSQNEISNTWVLSINNQTGDVTIDAIGSSNNTYDDVIHLTQAQFDALAVKDPNTLYSTPDDTDWEGFAPANAWTTWQVLTKTANSYQWSDASVTSVNWQTGDVSLSIPTNTSDLTNDSWFVTNQVSDDSYSSNWNGDTTHAPSKNAMYNKINSLDTDLNNKQDTLVSWTNIKTINGESVLGSGDISVSSLVEYTQAEYDALPSSKESDGVWRLIYE